MIEVASKIAPYGEDTIDRLDAYQRQQLRTQWPSASGPGQKGGDKVDLSAAEGHNLYIRDQKLSTRFGSAKGLFGYHTWLLTKREFVSTIRDPTISVLSLLVYLTVPVAMWLVYPPDIGTASSCPRVVRNISMSAVVDDATQSAISGRLDELNNAYECTIMFYLTIYTFLNCATVVSSMTFPLSMHILLKETRNGWYEMPAFVWAKTLANFPIESLYPAVSLVMVYYMIGMPSFYMHWRMIALAVVVVLVTMVANAQGLIFGAMLMDNTQAATLLALATAANAGLLSGYSARIKSMPPVLQHLSWFNPLRYAAELIGSIMFGFGICPCEQERADYVGSTRPQITDLPDGMGAAVRFFLNTQRDPDEQGEGPGPT